MPKKIAVDNPKAEEIFKIAKKLGYKAVLEADKAYPAAWHEGGGRVLIEKGPKKTELINSIATELKKETA